MENKVDGLLKLKEYWHKKAEEYGEDVSVGDYTYGFFKVHSWHGGEKTKLKIGKFCSLAQDAAFFLGGEHRSDFVTTYPFNILLQTFSHIKGHPSTKGDIIVGNDVWIGQEANILSGVKIGDGAIVGAEAVVTKDVPPYAIVAGNPAKFIWYRFDKETIEKLLEIKWWDFKEEELIDAIPLLQSDNIEEFINKYY